MSMAYSKKRKNQFSKSEKKSTDDVEISSNEPSEPSDESSVEEESFDSDDNYEESEKDDENDATKTNDEESENDNDDYEDENEDENDGTNKKGKTKVIVNGNKRIKLKSTEIFVPTPTIPDIAPDVPYTKDTIHPNTFNFLDLLSKNNNREWFWSNEEAYRKARKDADEFIECWSEEIQKIDDTIPYLPVKDIAHRIYRDVRLSEDKTPFKPYFSATCSRTGKKTMFATYDIVIGYTNFSFIGTGMRWMYASDGSAILNNIRTRLDQKGGKSLKKILMNKELDDTVLNLKNFRKMFPDSPLIHKGNKITPIDIFISMNQEYALKRAPKGYPLNHKDIELLKLKKYTLQLGLTREDFYSGTGGAAHIAKKYLPMVPFVQYLNKVYDQLDTSDEE